MTKETHCMTKQTYYMTSQQPAEEKFIPLLKTPPSIEKSLMIGQS